MSHHRRQRYRCRCKSAVLCTHYEPGYFLVGGYDKKVYHSVIIVGVSLLCCVHTMSLGTSWLEGMTRRSTTVLSL